MLSIIAQGDGFYGSAFMTTAHTIEEAHRRLLAGRGFTVWGGVDTAQFYVRHDDVPHTTAQIQEFDRLGNAQPNPVLLFDSGNSERDLELLSRIHAVLAVA